MAERLSLTDDTLLSSHAEAMVRLRFAKPYCTGRRVLDAACGTGYAAEHLRDKLGYPGALSVHGVDISEAAVKEALAHYERPNVTFQQLDLHDIATLDGTYGAVLTFEALAHLADPDRFLDGVARKLELDGKFILSTPNAPAVPVDAQGKPLYRWAHRTYTASQLHALLDKRFSEITLYGQWQTPQGKLRQVRARQQHEMNCGLYYCPTIKLGRLLLKLFGKPVPPPPEFYGSADSFEGDYTIAPIADPPLPWEPRVLVAVCSGPRTA